VFDKADAAQWLIDRFGLDVADARDMDDRIMKTAMGADYFAFAKVRIHGTWRVVKMQRSC
jgi:hypothetical protein